MRTYDRYVLGLDVGIATVGWALLNEAEAEIGAAGVWAFDAPETPKEGVPKTAVRRSHRGQRRVISRRRQRMNSVRALFAEAGLLSNAGTRFRPAARFGSLAAARRRPRSAARR